MSVSVFEKIIEKKEGVVRASFTVNQRNLSRSRNWANKLAILGGEQEPNDIKVAASELISNVDRYSESNRVDICVASMPWGWVAVFRSLYDQGHAPAHRERVTFSENIAEYADELMESGRGFMIVNYSFKVYQTLVAIDGRCYLETIVFRKR